MQPNETRTEGGPAVRRVKPGDDLNYKFAVFNATVGKSSASPRLAMQMRMYRNGKEVFVGEVTPLRLEPQADWRRISLAGSFKLSANARQGEYMIQLLITDTLASRKHRVASQWADFEIIDK